MAHYSSPYEAEAWGKWINNQDNQAANELIHNYQYLVNYHCKRISAHLPNSVSKEDIKSLGLIGLYDALKKFDPSRDLKFDTYASFRIKGAILDGLRKEDWLPRSIREKAKGIEKASQELEQILQRPVTSKEIANHLNMTEKEVDNSTKDVLFANVLSMEEKANDSEGEYKEGIGYIIPADHSFTPEKVMLNKEDYKELAEGIEKLNQNEKMVVSLFYTEELTLTEIGQILGLTTSRISQIHRKAIFKLKKMLTEKRNQDLYFSEM